MIRVAVDAMGGDHAPAEVVTGALAAARLYQDIEVILVGPEQVMRQQLQRHGGVPANVRVLHAPDVIGFDEAPVQAIRKKKESSIVKGLNAVRDGAADAFVSAGSTGALMAGGLFILGRIPGVQRPALAAIFPHPHGVTLALDVGATTDCDAENLLQWARMGAAYGEAVLKMQNPRVGLLSVGTEEAKGSLLTKAAYPLLRGSGLNFVGNVEARGILRGECDVLVTDGFTGNVLLKATEGTALTIIDLLKEELTRNFRRKLGAALVKPGLKNLFRRLDYSEYGGTPFLGVQGALIKCHGSSKARAIQNGVRVAREFVLQRCLEKLRPPAGEDVRLCERGAAAAANENGDEDE